MLPPNKPDTPRLADVLTSSFASLRGQSNRLGLAAAERALIVVIDGLGHVQLKAHAGHARSLAGASKPLVSGFPTTTASALASIATGASPGKHGLVGYDAYVPGVGVRNQLRDWGTQMQPQTHQRVTPLWTADCAVVAEAKYSASGFTKATLRGAEYLGENDLEARVELAANAAASHALTYLYIPELDRVGHQHGVASAAWVDTLEQIDHLVGELARSVPEHGVLVTADHGMVDVPESRHVLLDTDALPALKAIAGEPRGRQLVLEDPTLAAEAAASLAASLGKTAWVATRDEIVAEGWFGAVDPEVLPRLGDVIVLSRGRHAHYFDADDAARGMIGQHGSMTDDELLVPLIRLGRWQS